MRTLVLRARRSRASLVFMALTGLGDLLLLRFLQDHPLVDVAHALALVRLGRAIRANDRGDLTHELLVDALDDDLRLLRGLDLDALGHHVHDRMREAER